MHRGRVRAAKRKRGNDLHSASGEKAPQPVYFTQEDPIGLAGGMNLYGYAGGDPINFDDPFGLCPRSAGGDGKTLRFDDCPEGTEGYSYYQSSHTAFAAEATGAVPGGSGNTCASTAAGAVITVVADATFVARGIVASARLARAAWTAHWSTWNTLRLSSGSGLARSAATAQSRAGLQLSAENLAGATGAYYTPEGIQLAAGASDFSGWDLVPIAASTRAIGKVLDACR